jgi:hypothetical protein
VHYLVLPLVRRERSVHQDNVKMTSARWKSAFGWAVLVLWIGILLATLFPYQFHPHNDVKWLEGGGLWFGKHGVVLSQGSLLTEAPSDDSLLTLEILLRPASYGASTTILAFSSKEHPVEIELRQYRDGLVLLHNDPAESSRFPYAQRDVIHGFGSRQTILLTITSGPKGIAVYSNGRLLQRFPGYTFSRRSLAGEATLGTDPAHIDPWSGELRGLALYNEELSPAQIAESYQNWSHDDGLRCDELNGRTALFTFHEGRGALINNLCAGGTDLTIPNFFRLPFKPFLAPPWKEFVASWDYFNDVLRNILGFVPFGFALCGYLSMGRAARHAIWITVLAGCLTSLTIEILQGYLPQRESGITDIITNTSGALIGAYLIRWKPIRTYISLLT